MPVKTPSKKLPTAKPQAEATASELHTTSVITPLAQNSEGLPYGWRWVKLGDITMNFDGKRIPLSRDVRANRKGKFRYYGATEIVDYIDDYIFDGVYLLIGEDGANLLTKSRSLAFIVEGQFWVNNHAHVLQTKDNLLLKYLSNYFNSINLGQFVTGSAQPKLTQANLNKILVPLPPIKEQHAIVSKIEELLSELDKGKQQLETAQQQLKIYRQAVLKWAFEGKLTKVSSEDGFPEGWRIVRIHEIGKVKGGKRLPKGEAYSEEPTTFPYLRVTDFENQTINQNRLKFLKPSTQKEIKNYTISKDDVFISIAGTIGMTGTIPENLDGANLTENAAKITDLKGVYNKYLSQFLASINGQAQIKANTKTTTQPKLSLYRIDQIEVPLPRIDEQYLILQEIESRLSVCDKVEETITTSLAQSETLRQSLLKKAFEGKLI